MSHFWSSDSIVQPIHRRRIGSPAFADEKWLRTGEAVFHKHSLMMPRGYYITQGAFGDDTIRKDLSKHELVAQLWHDESLQHFIEDGEKVRRHLKDNTNNSMEHLLAFLKRVRPSSIPKFPRRSLSTA